MMLLSMLLNTSKTDTLLGIALIALGLVSATNLNDLNDSPASWGTLSCCCCISWRYSYINFRVIGERNEKYFF